MIAYLIGGPQDMVKLRMKEDAATSLIFPHLEATARDPGVPPSGDVIVKDLIYRKVHQSYGREPYAVFVLDDRGDSW